MYKEVTVLRKSQREVGDFDAVVGILDKCQTLRLGLFDGEYPYVVPLSFGWEVEDGKLIVYFHCAQEGKKIDLISRNNKVCIEADVLNGYKETDHSVTADYESVIAFGQAREVSGDEAVHGIKLLLEHCGVDGYSPEQCVMTKIVAVYKITVDRITGKKRFV